MEILSTVLDILFIFLPCIGYILQTAEMVKTRSAGGFSTYVSLILMVSKLVAIFWWFTGSLSDVLMATAFVAFVMQCILIFFWVKVMTDDGKKPFKDQSFWYWNTFTSYVTCLAAMGSTLAVTTFLLKENKLYGELLMPHGQLLQLSDELLKLPG